jgi:hypothetical protein
MRFLDFLEEQKEKHAVLAFGRFNPPTVGHSLVVDKVKDVAKTFKADHHIVLSHSQDKAKNPLTGEQKLLHAKRFFPKTNLSLSDKDSPNFLTQAAKLHKAGVTHLHMVAGSDRTDEYYKLLHKYNGTHKGALFNFKHIKVHSAGERDPDADGATGMSASKMRAHASSNNFKEFKKGIPSHVKDQHAKELFDHVRQGMNLKEDIDSEFEMLLTEGVHDKGIFKAVFLGGGPGSGKDYVLDRTLSGHGLTEINSDKALEFLMDKNNLDMRMPEDESQARNVVRGKAKNMTELKQRLALFGRNGLIINGTGDDVEKIAKIKERLENLGYESQMIMVNTADEVSQQRNIERGQRGGRTVPENIRKQKWDAVQAARPEHAKLFGDNYFEFDNSEDLRNAPPEVVQQKEKELMDLYKGVQKFVSKPPKNPSAQSWVAAELNKKDTLKVNTKKEVTSHEGSKAAEEARSMGLQYYGFGRYGRGGKVTHRSVHDKLVEVETQEKQNLTMPVPGTSMKKVNEEFAMLEESVTVSITADTPEEINQAFEKLFSKQKVEHQEQYEFSGTDALNVLTLGKNKTVADVREGNITFSNDDVNTVMEEKNAKYITDGKGNIRVFMLRRAAAKEAHQKNGTVQPNKNGGYVVKLNEENHNVQISKRPVQTENTRSGTVEQNYGPNYGFGNTTKTERESQNFLCEETGNYETKKYKISLEEIRRKQKEKIEESIDKGIEPGLSMAASGENMSRGVIKTKQIKKPLEELTGDETTASIGDQKEDELKKGGISLTSFKKRNFI